MDTTRRKNYYRSPRSNTIQYNGSYRRNYGEDTSKYQYFKSPRLRMQSYQRINDYRNSTNFKSVHPRKKPLVGAVKKPFISPEDAEEAERKKKLSDTANKILSKIKTLTSEKDHSNVSSSKSSTNNLNAVNESSSVNQSDSSEHSLSKKTQSCSEQKPKRIAHSLNKNKLCSVRKLVNKTVKRTTRMNKVSKKFHVNKAAVKDFQNRIQHKLIHEIMQMPKENLQNMLNNPKINPLMQVKISHLVKENRLLIAQKLRAMAESKMNSKDLSVNSQFLVDIDKLIDPVIETDLSVLPYDLIKQMEDIFQVQFDYSENKSMEEVNSESKNAYTDSSVCQNSNLILLEPSDDSNSVEMLTPEPSNDIRFLIKNHGTLDEEALNDMNDYNAPSMYAQQMSNEKEKTENCMDSGESKNADDLLYECSTDEDEDSTEANFSIPIDRIQENNQTVEHENPSFVQTLKTKLSEAMNKNKTKTQCEEITIEDFILAETDDKIFSGNEADWSEDILNTVKETSGHHRFDEHDHIQFSETNTHKNNLSVGCQTESSSQSVMTQTQTFSSHIHNHLECLYGVPVPKESTDESSSSLLNEVNAIQNLINRLNERRFTIFLKLSRIHPHGEFIRDSETQINFIESMSNGSNSLADKLNTFFSGNINQSIKTAINETIQSPSKRKRTGESANKELCNTYNGEFKYF